MTDRLTNRLGIWHFIRRVPEEYAKFDTRVLVRHSTKIRVAQDPRGIAAQKVADRLNAALETYWLLLQNGSTDEATREYGVAMKAAVKMRVSAPIDDPSQRTIQELLNRIAALERARSSEDRPSALAALDAINRPSLTFKQCAEKYIEAQAPGWTNPRHTQQWRSTLATYAYPFIGDMPINQITNGIGTEKITEMLKAIWYTKTETASRVRGRVETVLDWAKSQNLREGENPARWTGHLEYSFPSKEKIAPVRHQPAMAFTDLPNFMKKLQMEQGIVARALEFTVLTAGRSSQTLLAQKTEIDRSARLWIVPKERMKTRKEHRVPLCDAALAILDALPKSASKYVFPGRVPGKPLANNAMLRVMERMGVGKNEAVAHGFRSTFRDWGAEVGDYPNELLEMAIAHEVSDKVEAAYRRGSMLAKRHKLMADWEAYCYSKAA